MRESVIKEKFFSIKSLEKSSPNISTFSWKIWTIEGFHLAKSITDASWNQFLQFLSYKAAEAGRQLGLYKSQNCHQCGHREAKKLSERTYCCSKCGYKTTRDLNAAQNILALGLNGLGIIL
jgi:putative transposase